MSRSPEIPGRTRRGGWGAAGPPGGCSRARRAAAVGPATLRGDQGSASLWVLALIAVIWLVGVTVMVAGGVRAARQRAHAAADGAALAAAAHAAQGRAAACRIASVVARGTGARLTACALSGAAAPAAESPEPVGDGSIPAAGYSQIADVSVVVAFHVPMGVGTLTAPARARAGPVGPPDR